METVITATALVRQLGDILGRVRYRGETFVIERNGVVVARLTPVEPAGRGNLRDALRAWRDAGPPDPDFADALERIGAADREPGNPWDS
jgi:antitoxin (DNA-binding transcriptional repressor) of toxin-antitoxin stability system